MGPNDDPDQYGDKFEDAKHSELVVDPAAQNQASATAASNAAQAASK
jgi:hypothetical protein